MALSKNEFKDFHYEYINSIGIPKTYTKDLKSGFVSSVLASLKFKYSNYTYSKRKIKSNSLEEFIKSIPDQIKPNKPINLNSQITAYIVYLHRETFVIGHTVEQTGKFKGFNCYFSISLRTLRVNVKAIGMSMLKGARMFDSTSV